MISQTTGKILCGQPQNFKTEVFEFWPSDLLEIFQKFGVRRKALPAFDSDCANSAASGLAPEIVSPKKDLNYLVSFSKSKLTERIPLSAVSDADVKEVSWFFNQEFVGRVSSRQTLFHEARPGRYNVMVVDDRGRTASREIEIKVSR